MDESEYIGKVAFAVGTGRCGTRFLSEIMKKEPAVASAHEKHPLSDTFHRYCKWYGLPVDHEGFLATKERAITADLTKKSVSFEASAYLSLSLEELFVRFKPKFILLVRSPEKVVNSYVRKGWYQRPLDLKDTRKIPSYQAGEYFHHFLGRTIPKGEELAAWKAMSRVGKLAWYWKTLNAEVLRQFDNMPPEHWRIVRLEDLDYACYRSLCSFIGFDSRVTEKVFQRTSNRRPNFFKNPPKVDSWSEEATEEFEAQVGQMAERFGYEYRVANLIERASRGAMEDQLSSIDSPGARWLRKVRNRVSR